MSKARMCSQCNAGRTKLYEINTNNYMCLPCLIHSAHWADVIGFRAGDKVLESINHDDFYEDVLYNIFDNDKQKMDETINGHLGLLESAYDEFIRLWSKQDVVTDIRNDLINEACKTAGLRNV